MKRPRIGIIGAGFMAKAHATCFDADGRVEIAAVSSRTPAGAEGLMSRFGVARHFTSWRELVGDPSIDIVDVTAPSALHGEMALAAIEAGKGVIIEKPMATDLEIAERVVEAVQRTHVPVLYAENRRFAPIFVNARALIDSGEIGSPLIFRINELGSGPAHGAWFWDLTLSGGGALMDMGIHGFGMCEWLLGARVLRLQSTVRLLKWKESAGEGIEDTASTSCEFDNGAVGHLLCSWGTEGGLDIRAEVYGTSGTLHLDQGRGVNGTELYRSEGGPLEGERREEERPHGAAGTGWSFPLVDEWSSKGHRDELRHYIDCFLEGRQPRSGAEDGLRALELVKAAYRSSELREEIEV